SRRQPAPLVCHIETCCALSPTQATRLARACGRILHRSRKSSAYLLLRQDEVREWSLKPKGSPLESARVRRRQPCPCQQLLDRQERSAAGALPVALPQSVHEQNFQDGRV